MTEVLIPALDVHLEASDQAWLTKFGVEPTWCEDDHTRDQLDACIALGSRRIDEADGWADRNAVVVAREAFMSFAKLDATALDQFRHICPVLIPLDTFIKTQREMHALGLDAVKVINTLPAAIGLAPESVQQKVANLTALGLDAVKVINTQPAAIGLAPESVQQKVRLLYRSAKVLKWDHSAAELINYYPALLSFNAQKLTVLRRLVAQHISQASRHTDHRQIASALIVPLEQYILALAAVPNDKIQNPERTDIATFAKAAKAHRMTAPERRTQALKVVGNGQVVGRLAVMYMSYRR